MCKNKFIFILSLIIAINLSLPTAMATFTAEINIRDSFKFGEKVYYDYTIISDEDTEAIIVPHIKCPSVPVAQLVEKNIVLTKNIAYENTYSDFKVEDFMESQTCTAYIRIIAPIEEWASKTFKIITNPSFSFNIKACKTKSCTKKAKIFIKSENIYLDYDSDIQDPIISAILTFPDKITKEMTLPTFIPASQVGTYTLEASAGKEGYKTITKKIQLGVIEEEAKVKSVSKCNANGVCDIEENNQNCPQDCIAPQNVKTNTNRIIILVVAVIIIVIAGFIYFYIKRKSSDNSSDNNI